VVGLGVGSVHFTNPQDPKSSRQARQRWIILKSRAQEARRLNADHSTLLFENRKGRVRQMEVRPLTTDSQHVDSCLVQLDEHAIVDLPQSEQLQNLLDLWANLVDTPNSHDESQLRVSRDVKVASLLGLTLQPDLISLLILVLLGIFLSPLEDIYPLGLAVDLSLNTLLDPDGPILGLPFPPLEDGLRDRRQLVSYLRHLLL